MVGFNSPIRGTRNLRFIRIRRTFSQLTDFLLIGVRFQPVVTQFSAISIPATLLKSIREIGGLYF